jgi:periplasmic divalent cation tolerance protein
MTVVPQDPPVEVVITAPDSTWLADLVRRLVEDGLAAAGHLTPVRSIYSWQGTVHDTSETRASLHTRASLVPAITARVDAQHPYEVPCVVALPITAASPAYLAWLTATTS